MRKGVTKEEIEQKIREAVRLEEKPHLAFTSSVIKQGENGVVLDMRLQVSQDGRVERRFYRKPFAMVKESGNYAEETFRRLRNTSTGRTDQEVDLEQYMAELRTIGVPENVIRRKVRDGIMKYTSKVTDGTLIRPAEVRADVRRRNREKQSKWFDREGNERPVLVVEEGMRRHAHQALSRLQRSGAVTALPGIPLVVERHAAREHQLLAPRNRIDVHCKGRNQGELCMRNVGGQCNGECIKRSVVYELKCRRCESNTVYIGETSRALGQRLAEHRADYIARRETSWAWHHVQRRHDGEQNLFGADFKVSNCQKERGAFRRPLREEVLITRCHRKNLGELLNDQTGFNSARDLVEVNAAVQDRS